MFTSWKTTIAGILTILATIWTGNLEFLFDNDPETVANFGLIFTQILVGLGLINSRDHNVTSEGEKVA